MTQGARQLSARLLLGFLTFVPILVLFCLVIFAPPDGSERARLMQFVGRFHPLSVHLPIAVLVLVPLVELVGRNRRFPHLLPSVDFLLGVATCGAIVAATLGWSLARSGGYSGPLATQHMWSGVFVAAMAWSCWVLRARASTVGLQRVYAAALIAAVGLVSWTGYRGGQLSQGENHLTQYMPAPFASLFGVADSEAIAADPLSINPATFYGGRVQPILATHCITCHGSNRHKANLRLDSYAAVMRGGKHGPVIKAGEPKGSELFRRITLPQSDDDFMPPENKRPVSAGDLKLIELWISSGASATQSVDSIKDLPSTSRIAVAEVTVEEVDPAVVAKQRADLAPTVQQLQKRFPNVIDYQSRDSADIVVNAAWMNSKFGDSEVATLAPLSERIISVDFSNTAITDRSAATIASMKNLRSLRLMHTRIGDATLQALGSLGQLETLNIFDTSVTPSASPALVRLAKLRRIYAGGTKLASASSLPQEIRDKFVF